MLICLTNLMFTGIIEAIGQVKEVKKGGEGASISIVAELVNNDIKVGDSVAINGVCLTVTSKIDNVICADIGLETLKVTTLGNLKSGDYVNVERPMQIGGRLGGHLVQGHVDGIGKISNINEFDKGLKVTLETPNNLLKYIIKRGSITVNGVSLTVTDVTNNAFKVFLIPHTLQTTTFKYIKAGSLANLEVDIIGKYVEKLTCIGADTGHEPSKITEEYLEKHGF